MYSKVEVITPELAKLYLEKNITNNRVVSHRNVDMFATAMRNGDWQLTSQGITFNENGELTDGQHRLMAIIKADKPVSMYVTYGEPNSSTIHDRGKIRSLTDIVNMREDVDVKIKRDLVSIANALFNFATPTGTGSNNVPDSAKIAFIIDNRPLLETVSSISKSGANHPLGANAQVQAATFCALSCGVSEDSLTKFFAVFNSGFQDTASESAAIVARKFVEMGWRKESHTYGTIIRKRIFDVTSLSIRDFVSGVPRRCIYPNNQTSCYFEPVKAMLLAYLSGEQK